MLNVDTYDSGMLTVFILIFDCICGYFNELSHFNVR